MMKEDTPPGVIDCDGQGHAVTFKFCYDGRKTDTERDRAAQAQAISDYTCAGEGCTHNARVDSVTATGNHCQLPGDDLNGKQYQVDAVIFCHPAP